ncbi:hypothetical protein AB205_0214770 [Aquarana catesbeiana]|uniref:Ig-like domain-containing protein n=1 Tax=Aquarana catesbeiana TaxID=8400 RepID=A0A2G9R7G9_AQUCT|nr:hypothetical protein AB205_0214770 [Aquarana catesbeiana]
MLPCCNALSSLTEVTIGCLTTDYIPAPVDVTWNSGSITTGIKNFPDTLSNNGKYISCSLLTISASDWKSKTYTCNVNHMSSGQKVDKTIPGTPPHIPSLNVDILQKTCSGNTNDQVELNCQGSNLTSKDVKIKWFINEKERLLPQELIIVDRFPFYGYLSRVTISRAEWNNGIRVKCQVTDTATSKSNEATARKCSDISNCLGIEVIMVPPTIEDLYIQKYAPIACTAYNLKQPTGSAFLFSYTGAPVKVISQTEDPQLNLNGTYSVTSILTVTPETWQSNTEFTCIFSFPGLIAPIIRTISKKTETKLIRPSIAVFSPTPEDIAKDELCIITCVAYGFYPESIYMGWVDEENVEISKDQHVNSEPKRNNRNQSYSATSLLSIPCSEWNEGKHYGCVVGHEAIPQTLSMKNIDKQSGNPSTVNVSVVLSDTNLVCH